MIRFERGQRIEFFPSGTTFFGTDTPDPWKLIQGSTIFFSLPAECLVCIDPAQPALACLSYAKPGHPQLSQALQPLGDRFCPPNTEDSWLCPSSFRSEAKCIFRVNASNDLFWFQGIASPCEKEDPATYQSRKQQPHGLDLTWTIMSGPFNGREAIPWYQQPKSGLTTDKPQHHKRTRDLDEPCNSEFSAAAFSKSNP